MRSFAERAALLALLVASACSDRSAPREEVGQASMPFWPLLGPPEDGWRLPSSGDFNGDGMRDVLWKDFTTKRVTVSLMNGLRLLEQGHPIPGPPGDDWLVVSAGGDRNFDGLSDVLWHDPVTNRFTVWLMRGTALLVQGPVIPGPPGDGWICLTAGDFNRDGMPDLLWYNLLTKQMTVWLMRGTAPFAQGPVIPGPPGDGWRASFGGDFDRDGMDDVLWYNATTSRMAVWLMHGTEVRERGPELPTPSGAGWILTTASDFNRDRMIDELWFNTRTKRMTVSLMSGTALLEQGPEIPGPPGDGWIVGNATDCDGDGMADVIWLNVSPLRIRIWLMNGPRPMVQGPDIAGPINGAPDTGG